MARERDRHDDSCFFPACREASFRAPWGMHPWKRLNRAYQLGLAPNCFDAAGQDFEGAQASNRHTFSSQGSL
jgi:hypothetical protein